MKLHKTTFFGRLAVSAAQLSVVMGCTDALAGPTFDKDVAPILYAHCIACHRPGEVAEAQPLLTYESVRPRAESIKTQVVSRRMPPWPADADHSLPFRNDARLARQDIDTLVAWVNSGAPRGNESDLPPVPASPQKWGYPSGRAPDAVLKLPEVTVAASGEIPYVQQRVKVPLSEDKWIEAMQVRPGNDVLVHHMGITEVSLADGVSGDDLDALAKVARQLGVPDDSLSTLTPVVKDSSTPGGYDMLGVYTPGTTFEQYGNDSAKLLKAGKNVYVNFNIHYTTTGRTEHNHSELALWFMSHPPQHQLFRAPAAVASLVASGRQLLTDDPGTKAEGTDFAIPPIPARAANYEVDGVTAYVRPVILYQLQPHAHMRGKDFTYSAVYPDGHEVTILTVPKYDFHWQLAYDLQTPLRLPAGSKLVVQAHYDNSSKNPHLREPGVDPRYCGPDKLAYFRRQNQSWHEMFSPLVQYSVDDDRVPGNRAPGDGHPASRGAGDPEAGSDPAPTLVEAVGCLTRGPSAQWSLAHASRPRVTDSQSTSAVAVRAAASTALGDSSLRLLGPKVFGPQKFLNQRVVVKGLLIGGAGVARLNVTSLQPLAGDCR